MADKSETTTGDRCQVDGCFVVRGEATSGRPPCLQGWSGDPQAGRDYLRKCMMKELLHAD